MVAISQVTVEWSGAAVRGGGVSHFYTEGPVLTLQNGVKALFQSTVVSVLPSSCTIHIPATGDVIEADTGEVTGVWSEGTSFTSNGTVSGGTYAAGVGARLIWNTAGRTNNRRVRGSTFLVPLAVGAYQNDGTIVDDTRNTLAAAAQALVVAVANDFGVWTRPRSGAGGAFHTVVSGSCSDSVTWLRSRRT